MLHLGLRMYYWWRGCKIAILILNNNPIQLTGSCVCVYSKHTYYPNIFIVLEFPVVSYPSFAMFQLVFSCNPCFNL